jgi:hypothetical protein
MIAVQRAYHLRDFCLIRLKKGAWATFLQGNQVFHHFRKGPFEAYIVRKLLFIGLGNKTRDGYGLIGHPVLQVQEEFFEIEILAAGCQVSVQRVRILQRHHRRHVFQRDVRANVQNLYTPDLQQVVNKKQAHFVVFAFR